MGDKEEAQLHPCVMSRGRTCDGSCKANGWLGKGSVVSVCLSQSLHDFIDIFFLSFLQLEMFAALILQLH